MNENDLLAAHRDILEESDDPALFEVVRELESMYARAEPPPELRQRVRDATSRTPSPAATETRGPSRRSRSLRRPFALAGAALVLAALAGGAAYAMKGLGLFSGPHIRSTCNGTTITIAKPAYRVASPDAFARKGGTLYARSVAQARRLPRPSYWVLPSGSVVVNTCVGASVSDIEIGRNPRNNTELHAYSVVPFGQSTEPTFVGALLIPTGHGCAFRRRRAPVPSPDSRPVAQLMNVPADLSAVSVLFTPCGVPTRNVPTLVPPAQEISFHIFSEVRYRGPAGTVIVLVARPSPAAARPGLNLGNPAGRLPSGARLYALNGDVRWLDHGRIVSVSGDVSLSRLKRLAADVVIRS